MIGWGGRTRNPYRTVDRVVLYRVQLSARTRQALHQVVLILGHGGDNVIEMRQALDDTVGTTAGRSVGGKHGADRSRVKGGRSGGRGIVSNPGPVGEW